MDKVPYRRTTWKEKTEILQEELKRFPEILEGMWRKQREEKEFAERVCGPAVEEYLRIRDRMRESSK